MSQISVISVRRVRWRRLELRPVERRGLCRRRRSHMECLATASRRCGGLWREDALFQRRDDIFELVDSIHNAPGGSLRPRVSKLRRRSAPRVFGGRQSRDQNGSRVRREGLKIELHPRSAGTDGRMRNARPCISGRCAGAVRRACALLERSRRGGNRSQSPGPPRIPRWTVGQLCVKMGRRPFGLC